VSKVRLLLLIAALSAGVTWYCASAARADADLLRSLASEPAAKLPSAAREVVAAQPDRAAGLTLDLLFYLWACAEYRLPPGPPSLHEMVAALVGASADPSVTWAAAAFGPPGSAIEPAAPESADERIGLLSRARQALLAAIEDADTYPTRSIESLRTCSAALARLKLTLSEALVCTRLAERQLYSVRRYRDAVANYERARPVFSAYGLRAQAARIFDDLGHLNSERARYDDAYTNYWDSAREWQALGEGALAGKQYINAGSALAAAGEQGRALRTMLDGLEASRKYAWDKNSYGAHAKLLLQVASYCSDIGHTKEAQGLLAEAEEIGERANDPLLVASALRASARAWKDAGEDAKARQCLEKWEKVLAGVKQEGLQAVTRLADFSISVSEQASLLAAAERGASACVELGDYQDAISVLKSAAAVYEARQQDDDQIRVLRSLASCYDAMADRRAGLVARGQAAQIGMRLAKYSLVVEILGDIQQSASDAQDPGTALEALREAVPVIEKSGDMLALADVLETRGMLQDSVGQPEEATRDLGRAAAIYRAELGEPWSQARVLEALAGVQAKAEWLQDALASLSQAIQRIEEWSAAEAVDPDAEPGHAEALLRLYLQAVGLELRENRDKEALDLLLRARRHPWFGQLRSYLVASQEAAAQKVLKEFDKAPGASNAEQRLQPGGLRKTAGDWNGVLSKDPYFSRLARQTRNVGHVAPIDAADIRKIQGKLPDGLAIVEYVVTESGTHILIVTARTVGCWQTPATSDQIDSAVRALGRALADTEARVAKGVPIAKVTDWNTSALRPIMDPLYALQKMILEPIRRELGGVDSLAFVLPWELSGVPLHALAREKGGTVRFVIQDYAVSYVIPETLEEFSKPVHVPLDARKARVAIFADMSGTVPGAAAETNLIRAYYRNNQLYTGARATVETFTNAALSSHIIHIAAHHQADPNPEQDSIVLSGSSGESGTLRFADLIRIGSKGAAKVELAVLAACETLGTAELGNAGALRAAQVFAVAGFPSVIGGLWKVTNAASVELVQRFYRELAQTGRRAEALQRAQKSMVESKNKDFANPFCWAGFALYGDPR